MKRNPIILPKAATKDLAYICGFILGDGHLCIRKERSEYHVVCIGNLKDEKEFYDEVILPLFKKLFGVKFRIKINKNDNTINAIYYSKDLLKFFSQKIGLPTGAKSSIIKVPEIFKKSNILFKAFLQGYADADFCLCLKKRYSDINYYPVISCLSRSSKIVEEISEFLRKLGFSYYLELNKPKFDKRLGKSVIMSSIILYGHNNLVRWMKEISFRNTKVLKTFKIWKERNATNPHAAKALKLL